MLDSLGDASDWLTSDKRSEESIRILCTLKHPRLSCQQLSGCLTIECRCMHLTGSPSTHTIRRSSSGVIELILHNDELIHSLQLLKSCKKRFPVSTAATMSLPIPQPPGIPLLGNIFDIDPKNTWNSLNKLADKYGMITHCWARTFTNNFAQGQSSKSMRWGRRYCSSDQPPFSRKSATNAVFGNA